MSGILCAQAWTWAYKGGGIRGVDIDIDKWNNLYTITFGGGPYGVIQLQANGNGAIAKHAADGTLIWANAFGNVDAKAIACDSSGNSYVTGIAFDGGNNVFYGNNSSYTVPVTGQGDAFLVKYGPAGNLLWAQSWGLSVSIDSGEDVDVDDQGNVYVTGQYQKNENGNASINTFVRKVDPAGNLIWINDNQWQGQIVPKGIAIDGAGNAFVTGAFTGTSYLSNIQLIPNTNKVSMFIAKYDSGGSVAWARKLGDNYDVGESIALGPGKSIFIAGWFTSPTNFDNIQLANSSGNGALILKLDSIGTVIAGNVADNSYASDICINAQGVYVSGYFKSEMNFITSVALPVKTTRTWETFVSEMNFNCTANWLMATGGSTPAIGGATGVALDNIGGIYVSGGFQNSIAFGSQYFVSSDGDSYVAKIGGMTVTSDPTLDQIFTFVYPIPTSGNLKVICTSAIEVPRTINLYSLLGELLDTESYNSDNGAAELELSKYPKGVYLVSVVMQSGKLNMHKIIIQ
jgi:hypothetical protein